MSLKELAQASIGRAASTYIRRSPWAAGKVAAYKVFHDHYGWRRRVVVTRTRDGALMEVEPPDLISTVILATGQWEPAISSYVRQTLKPGDVFVDVGANIGYYTLLASRLVGSRGRVVAIEAGKEIYMRLVRNVALNLQKNVSALRMAASDKPGKLQVFDGKELNVGHTTTVESTALKEGLKCSGTVLADTLPNLLGMYMTTARLIKVDVEGAELAVLSAVFDRLPYLTSDWLLELTPEHCAGGQSDVDEIFHAFMRAGYRAWQIPNQYTPAFMVNGSGAMQRITEPPRQQADVLMSVTRH